TLLYRRVWIGGAIRIMGRIVDPKQPAPIPDREWDEPATLAALAQRDARGLLRLGRKYGASQYYLSARAMYVTGESLTQNQISLIATGKARVEKLGVWERLAAALDMPDRARVRLGLAPREYEPATGGGHDPVMADIETIRRSLTDALDQCTVNEPGIADWEQAALAYGRATRHTAPARLLRGLSVDYAELPAPVRARQPARLQRRLSYVTAQ